MQVRTDYGLTEDKVKCAPGLDRALSNFAASLPMSQQTTTSNGGLAKHDVTLVTDGPLQGWEDARSISQMLKHLDGLTLGLKSLLLIQNLLK